MGAGCLPHDLLRGLEGNLEVGPTVASGNGGASRTVKICDEGMQFDETFTPVP